MQSKLNRCQTDFTFDGEAILRCSSCPRQQSVRPCEYFKPKDVQEPDGMCKYFGVRRGTCKSQRAATASFSAAKSALHLPNFTIEAWKDDDGTEVPNPEYSAELTAAHTRRQAKRGKEK